MDDRLMTAKQLGDYLNINERTVLKLVGDGSLPGVKVGNQWRFRKAMIDTWLDDQMLGVTPKYLDTSAIDGSSNRLLELEQCLQPSHIQPDLIAKTKTGVIEELAGLSGELGLVQDRTWFVGALIERENVLPSAMGNRTAFLHTLHRHPRQITRPFLVVGRSVDGVDFDALDDEPTHLFFVMGLKYEVLHLPWMHKLTHMLANQTIVDELCSAPDASAIFRILSAAENRMTSKKTPQGK